MQLSNIKNKIDPVSIDEISTASLWNHHDKYIFRSNRVGEIGNFYPIYQFEDLYSFSIFPLILLKGRVDVDETFVSSALRRDVALPNPTIDREIKRLGGVQRFTRELSDPIRFAQTLAEAIASDINDICARNPHHDHVILCGGKDSLNLLLHNWPKKPLVYSAQPNLPIVRNFVRENGLELEVNELIDINPDSNIKREILESSLLVEIDNWKWTQHLRDISKSNEGKVIFWKGQVADALLTDYWISYTSSQSAFIKFIKKATKKIARQSRSNLAFLPEIFVRDFEDSLWERASVAQGGHLGYLRSICDALFLSAYHGPKASSVINRMDLRCLTHSDLRPQIGERLLGRKVIYPMANPSPPASEFRKQLRTMENYIRLAHEFGLEVY
jgi:hypothetical protein